MKNLAKLIALLPLAIVLFLGNAYGSLVFAGLLFPRIVPRPYVEMISAAVVGAMVGGILIGYPLARMFPSRYWAAALLVSLPLIALRFGDLYEYVGTRQTAIITMSTVELALIPLGAVLGTCLFAKFSPRLQNAA